MQRDDAGVMGEVGGQGEEPQPQSLGLPAAGGMLGEGEHLGPGGDVAGQRDDGLPDPVLVQPVQGQVAQPGVLRGADAVLGPGVAGVSQLQVGELPPGTGGGGVGGPGASRSSVSRCSPWWAGATDRVAGPPR